MVSMALRFFASTWKAVQIWDFIRKNCQKGQISESGFLQISMKQTADQRWKFQWNFNKDFNEDYNMGDVEVVIEENKTFSCFWGDHSLRLTGMIRFDYMWECFLEFSLITRTIWFGDKGRCPPWLTTDYLTYPSPPLSLPYGMFPICSYTINQGTKLPLNIIYITI